MNPLRKAIHVFMETTRLDRLVDEHAINHHREKQRARRSGPLEAAAANDWIGNVIAAGKPAAVGILGEPECRALSAHLGLRKFYKYTWAAPAYSEAELPRHGVFPETDEIYWRFSELYRERLREFDGCALSLQHGESKILTQCCPQAKRLNRHALEPWRFDAPWSARLAGKKVLVIHPYEPSIRSQFARRASIWPQRPDTLPACTLETARSPYGFSRSGFNDWLLMLHWFEQRVATIHKSWPFEIALIGCGVSGIPIAAHVKKLGAIGIHVGDALPVLFGIRDEACNGNPGRQPLTNPSWVEPQASERPIPPSR
jgi:hypothetical protein